MQFWKSSGKQYAQAGFTLIEILIVMIVIGILVTISIGSFSSAQQKGRDTKRKSDLKQISNSLDVYFNDKGSYPLSSSGRLQGCNGDQNCDWGDTFQDENSTVYMVELPSDPRSNLEYRYESSDGRSYQLYARLENTLDRDVPKTGSDEPQIYNGLSCGDVDCNYGISSSNTSPDDGRSLVVE
jgi:general secretion pathway protein G